MLTEMLAGTPAGTRGSVLLSADLAATAGDALSDPANKPKAKKLRKRKTKTYDTSCSPEAIKPT